MNVSTFEELREAIQTMASTITLTNSFSTSGDSILIDHSVFIEGSGFTISRSTSFTGSFFTISNGTVIFSNFTLDGNQQTNVESLINLTGGSLSLEQVTLQNNQSTNGGAINAQSSSSTNFFLSIIGNSIIENCQATLGGGIYAKFINSNGRDSITVSNQSEIRNNQATLGGGIYLENNDQGFGHINLVNQCVITNNQARDGGGIYYTNSIANQFQSSTTLNLIMNTATNQGGTIVNDEGTIENNGDSFSNNKSNNRGGAIYNSGNSTITINDITTILRNQAALGGGIYNTNGGELILRSTEFFQNQATEKGGGIFNDQNSVTKMIDSVSMSENESSQGKDFYNQGRLEIQGLVQMTTGLYLPSEATVPIITNPLSKNSRIQLENSTYVTPSTGSPIVIGKADPNQYPLLQDGDANSYQKPPIDFNNWIIRLSDDRKEVWLFLNVVTYAITYCNLNGSTTTNPTTYTENDLPILLTPPTTRRCRVFIGWYLDDQKITTIPVGTTGNLTICARFERVSKSNFRCRNHEFHDRNYSEM